MHLVFNKRRIIENDLTRNDVTRGKPTKIFYGGARGVVVIAVGIEHGDTSSNPGRD